MVIIREKQRFDEMAIRVISSPSDNLPFKITVMSPDKGKSDHAHILKLRSKKDELGTIVITKDPPKSVADIIGYTDGNHSGLRNLSEDQLQAIVDWASRRNSLFPGTNWQALQYEYFVNRRS
jgi:hypothetical protein